MEYDIAAKPTIYKGFRFRSRLEARWAVFFDQIGVKWEYEPDSWDVEGVQLTPDFVLYADSTYYVEVKPEGFLSNNREEANELLGRYETLARRLLVRGGILLLAGDPFTVQASRSVSLRGAASTGRDWGDSQFSDMYGHVKFMQQFPGADETYGLCVEDSPDLSLQWEWDRMHIKPAEYARQYDFMHFLPN